MVRTVGAKNLPKTVAQLTKMLRERAETEGLELTLEVKEKAIAAVGDAANAVGLDVEKAMSAAREKFDKLEIELEAEENPANETDTYRCGNCNETMASQMDRCPNCGAGLKWT